MGSPIHAHRDGSYSLRLDQDERAALASLLAEMREVVMSDDAATARLFPAAYGTDEERNAGWAALARDELIERRLQALDDSTEALGRKRLSGDELGALMRSLNDVRLVLGTMLDVSEDAPPRVHSEPQLQQLGLYEALTELVWACVEALGARL
jgi:hypothetical protein